MGPLILFGLFFLIIIAAIIYAIILLAIEYWPITLTIIGLIILRCKWDWVKSKQAEKRRKREQQKIMDAIKAGEEKVKRQKAERERKWWEDFWNNYDNLFIQKIALPDKTEKRSKGKKEWDNFQEDGAYNQNQRKNKKKEKAWDDFQREWEEFQRIFGYTAAESIEKYYKILGLSPKASVDQVKSKFRELAKKYHPDKNRNKKDAAKKFIQIFEARQKILGVIEVTA